MKSLILLVTFAFASLTACNAEKSSDDLSVKENSMSIEGLDSATFGGGCFWCVEAVFQRLKGVEKVVSGYSGGKIENPTYQQVTSGETGHAEVVRLYYNPSMITFEELLEVFWKTHDPTTLNRQGADVGTQYRSVIFYHDDKQKQIAEHYKELITKEKIYDAPIVTEISPLLNFYEAEYYHQNYYNQNMHQPYCSFVITPKVRKLEQLFKEKLKK